MVLTKGNMHLSSLGNRMLSEKMTSDSGVDFSIDPKHEVRCCIVKYTYKQPFNALKVTCYPAHSKIKNGAENKSSGRLRFFFTKFISKRCSSTVHMMLSYIEILIVF